MNSINHVDFLFGTAMFILGAVCGHSFHLLLKKLKYLRSAIEFERESAAMGLHDNSTPSRNW